MSQTKLTEMDIGFLVPFGWVYYNTVLVNVYISKVLCVSFDAALFAINSAG